MWKIVNEIELNDSFKKIFFNEEYIFTLDKDGLNVYLPVNFKNDLAKFLQPVYFHKKIYV